MVVDFCLNLCRGTQWESSKNVWWIPVLLWLVKSRFDGRMWWPYFAHWKASLYTNTGIGMLVFIVNKLSSISWVARLHIPVFRNIFLDQKNRSCQDSWGYFFPCVFRRNFSQERGFGGGRRNSRFCRFHRNFSQEFLWDRNSCIYSGFLRISPDSSGFLFPPNAVWLRPADKFSPN